MKRKKILNTQNISPEIRQLMEETCDIIDIPIGNRSEILSRISNCEGILTSGGLKIDGKLLDAAPNLRLVSNMAVGYNNFDLHAMKTRNIIGTNTPYVLDDSVADTALTLMLCCARRACELDAYTKEGTWGSEAPANLFGLEVSGKTLGIVGMGRIGMALAKRAVLGLDMKLLYHARNAKPEAEQRFGAVRTSLDELMEHADFIVVLTPLTPETKGLIGEKELRRMKETGIFINISRGDVVNEQALIRVLKERKIYSAGLDVYQQEPVDPQNPLLQMPHVVTLPHIGSATRETREKMALRAARNLLEGLTGSQPQDTVPELR